MNGGFLTLEGIRKEFGGFVAVDVVADRGA